MRRSASPQCAVSRAHRVSYKRAPVASANAEERDEGILKNLKSVRGERAKIGAAFWGLRKESR